MKPTLEQFRSMSLGERSHVFLNWVREQPPEKPYLFYRIKECPLAQFGTYIIGSPCNAGDVYFCLEGETSKDKIDVIPPHWAVKSTDHEHR